MNTTNQAPLKPKTEGEILSLIYANGRNAPAVIVFHEDGGHGWLQIPQALSTELGITGAISQYSYLDANFFYLEEDCDLSLFFKAIGFDTDKELAQLFWNHVPSEYKEDSPIRSKSSMRRLS
jgi:hypothetical protein